MSKAGSGKDISGQLRTGQDRVGQVETGKVRSVLAFLDQKLIWINDFSEQKLFASKVFSQQFHWPETY